MRRAIDLAVLHVVVDSAGERASFGDLQAAWLVAHGVVVRTADSLDGIAANVYTAQDPDSVRAIHELVLAQADLRECDFCRQVPTRWQVNHEPFDVTHVIQGRLERPLFACDICVGYIDRNEKDKLIEYAIAATVEYAKAQGGPLAAHARSLPWALVKQGLTPMVREIVYGMFATRRGRPERIEGTDG